MPVRLTCSNGHHWDAADPAAPCPVCNAAPQDAETGPYDPADQLHCPDQQATPGAATVDHLQPPSTPDVPVAPAPFQPTATHPFPTVPGYEIEGILGRGGMGVVYKARHLALKRTVALKMIRHPVDAGPLELARFQAEAEAVARLQHPNIVQVYEVGTAGGSPFFALEFVEGGSLARRLKGESPPPREAARLVETLARAMNMAHSRNVIHRDLKPANILLAGDGTPKVADFGMAKQLDVDSGETRAGAVMGTPSYTAPEQASGQAYLAGPLADVYALGAILYECLTGKPPFKGATPLDTLEQVRTMDPTPPARLNPKVPRDLETVCLKCLRKEPDRRYASAQELADDLDRFVRGEPVLARPVGRLGRGWRWCRRNPVLATTITLAAVALLTSTVLALIMARNAEMNARADRERLWTGLLAQARAERQAGNRWESLERIEEAAKIKVTDELRREAFQTITSSGMRLAKEVSARVPRMNGMKSIPETLRKRLSDFDFPMEKYKIGVSGESARIPVLFPPEWQKDLSDCPIRGQAAGR